MSNIIAISGTPGTGKTIVGRLLAKRLEFKFLDLTQLIQKKGLFSGKDFERDTLIADVKALKQYLQKTLTKTPQRYVIAGHLVDEIPDELIEIIVVLRCHPKKLAERLGKRKWSHPKIIENLQAEILGECTTQSIRRHPIEKIFEIDTTNTPTEKIVDAIELILAGKVTTYSVGQISWLRSLNHNLLHLIMEKNQLPKSNSKSISG